MWRQDTYNTFCKDVCILKDTKIGRLHIDDLDIPEGLQLDDVNLMDLICVHKVQVASREENIVVVTVVY